MSETGVTTDQTEAGTRPTTSEGTAMETTWRVTEVTERPGIVQATLQRVEWFKKNPNFDAAMADETQDELPEEFLDALPGDEGAETIEIGGAITLDITDGPELHPLNDVVLSLRVLTPVDV